MQDSWFFFLGLFTGVVGTLVGAGGGFLLAPVFLFLFPDWSPARLTAVSLLVVAANSTSGSIGYAVRKQVHWPSVALFSVMAIPGVFLGVEFNRLIARNVFEIFFAIFLVALGVFVFSRSLEREKSLESAQGFWNRRAQVQGSAISFLVGILSSVLGIGGGIVHVPLLSEFLGYPLHLAAGTSHAILALTSTVAVIEHFHIGDLEPLESFTPLLVLGLVIGAQFGAAISKKVERCWILRMLSVALFSVGFRLIYRNWVGG